jgi:hypothetical protein
MAHLRLTVASGTSMRSLPPALLAHGRQSQLALGTKHALRAAVLDGAFA